MSGGGFIAVVLLERPWTAEPEAVAEWMQEPFGAVVPIAAAADPGTGEPRLVVDGAPVPLLSLSQPRPADPPPKGFRPARGWDPEPALTLHRAHVTVSCEGPGTGPDWMRAYATVVTLVAGAIARMGPAMAVVFPHSGAVLGPREAFAAARTAVRGVSPVEAWITIAPVRPLNPGLENHAGAVTTGLLPLAGYEIELAPRPATPRAAVDRVAGAVWRVLDGNGDPAATDDPVPPAARRVPGWLRPGVPATVLVDAASPVDPETLTLPASRTPPLHEILSALASNGTRPALDALDRWADTVPARLRTAPAALLSLWRGRLRPRLAEAAAALPDMARTGWPILSRRILPGIRRGTARIGGILRSVPRPRLTLRRRRRDNREPQEHEWY